MAKRTFQTAFGDAFNLPEFATDNNQISSQIQTHMNDYRDFAQRINNGIFDSSASIAGNASKKTRYFKGDQGSSFPGINDFFTSQFKAPPLSSMIPKNFPQTRPRVDPHIVTTRRAKSYDENTEAVSAYELAILYLSTGNKEPNQGVDILRSHEFNDLKHFGQQMIIEDRLVDLFNPATWNFIQSQIQYEMFTEDRERYFELDPNELWSQFSFDGIVKNEEDSSRGENVLPGYGPKILTVNTKGAVKTFNIFGRSVYPGYKCFAIIKKMDAPKDFILSTKSKYLDQGQSLKISMNYQKEFFKPFQMSFIALPYNYVPMEYLEYSDENGIKNYGIGIRLGTIQFSPRYMDMGPPPPADIFINPHTNSLDAVWSYNDYLTIIFNDGWI